MHVCRQLCDPYPTKSNFFGLDTLQHSASVPYRKSAKSKQLHYTADGKVAVIPQKSQVQANEECNEKKECENEWSQYGCSSEGYLPATAQVYRLRLVEETSL